MGEELVRQFAAAGSYVTFGDVNEDRGKQLEGELNSDGEKVQFIKCDIADWDRFECSMRQFEKARIEVVML